MQYYLDVLKKYAVFSGRASRAEFWWFVLINAIIGTILMVVDWALHTNGISSDIYALATLIPNLAVGIRRLHDIGKSGWWELIIFVPFIGIIVLLLFYVKPGDEGENKFGPNPRGENAVAAASAAPAPAAPVAAMPETVVAPEAPAAAPTEMPMTTPVTESPEA